MRRRINTAGRDIKHIGEPPSIRNFPYRFEGKSPRHKSVKILVRLTSCMCVRERKHQKSEYGCEVVVAAAADSSVLIIIPARITPNSLNIINISISCLSMIMSHLPHTHTTHTWKINTIFISQSASRLHSNKNQCRSWSTGLAPGLSPKNDHNLRPVQPGTDSRMFQILFLQEFLFVKIVKIHDKVSNWIKIFEPVCHLPSCCFNFCPLLVFIDQEL